jgi:hypothetical protein
VVDEAGGSWGTAKEVPGLAALTLNTGSAVNSVSCASAGNCAAGGYYWCSSGTQAFVDDETRTHPTSTSISLSAPTVTYGDEQAEHVSVTVTSPGGTPGGTVAVKSGTSTVCTITLGSGRGSCALSATVLAAGTRPLTASYNGSANFNPSASAARTLAVSKAGTRTALSLSATRVTLGHEQAERLSVTVSHQYSGTPGGTVTVKSGTSTVCTITLRSGRGQCSLAARQLRTGTYTLIAVYHGNSNFTGSASSRKTLTVVQ